MRVTLDLLHEFANTEVFCLFHNCMWQSRHSEVNENFLAQCEQNDGLSTFNKSLRSHLICVYVFAFVFVFIYKLNRHWHTTINMSPCSYIGAFTTKQDIFFDLLGERLLTHGSHRSWQLGFGWIRWESLLLSATSEPNSFIQLTLKEIFGGGRGDAHTFSYMISPVSIMIAFGIQ